MKTKVITIIFILSAYIGFGQTSDAVSTKKISLGVMFSPDYCYRVLNSSTSNQWAVDYRDSTEIPKFGYTTGISLIYEHWNRISFETGLYYSDKGEKTLIMKLMPTEPNDPALPTNQSRFIYHYNYLDIPIKVSYIIIKGKVELFVSAGFSTNIFLYQSTTVRFEGSDETSTSFSREDMARLNGSLLVGGGIDYKINQKLNVRVEPIYRHSIIPLVDAPIKQYQYSIGAKFGLYYKLT